VATRDRPTHLRQCLEGLRRQATARPFEIVVVDNNPASGLTPPVVAELPGVRLVPERRRGLSYARNAGVLASRHEIIATVDDDVSCPPSWLEALVAPFARAEVGIVTGPILPLALDTDAQRAFEARGTLAGEGEARSVDRAWFDSFRLRAVPTWKLGTGANAAFRRRLFVNPEIGFFDERLGVGTPCGAAEESYLFYRALKAREVLCFEPRAVVRHHHHATMPALRRRVYDYSKGHVAYHLSTLLRDHDLRAVPQLLLGQPLDLVRRFVGQTLRDGTYPASLMASELLGYLVGPAELVRSSWRVRRQA
jgi:glycosyltransferase involved in cell wall biosynthesis